MQFLQGCATSPPRIPAPLIVDHVVEVQVTRPCALRTQPSYTPVGAPTLCQPGLACWTLAQLANLIDNVESLRDWADEMSRLCPPPPATQPASSPAGGTP